MAQSDEEATHWYKKGAEQEYALAQFNLGIMFLNGRGVEQNDAEAARWCNKFAADKGLAMAQHHMGTLHAMCRGVAER